MITGAQRTGASFVDFVSRWPGFGYYHLYLPFLSAVGVDESLEGEVEDEPLEGEVEDDETDTDEPADSEFEEIYADLSSN